MKKQFRLEDISKTNIYSTPEHYFNKLPGVIMARVTEEQPTTNYNWWNSLLQAYQVGFASIILVVSFVAAFLFSGNFLNSEDSYPVTNLSAVNQQETLEYMLLQDNLESGDLVELNLADYDASAEFISATPTDILETIDEQQLEEVYFN